MNEARMCQLRALLDKEFGKVEGAKPKLSVVARVRHPAQPRAARAGREGVGGGARFVLA